MAWYGDRRPLGLLVIAALPAAAVAQEGESPLTLPTINVTAAGETATGPVDGMVATQSATGTKTDTPILETPRSISVVTAEEIAQRCGAQTISATRGYTPGVFTVPNSSNRSGFNDRIRGFSDYGSIFVDGLPDPVGIDQAEPQLDPYAAVRVEVLKGPASVFYGQISPGGLVNIVTKRLTFGSEREVQAQVGSFDIYQGAFDLNGILRDGAVGWRLVGLGQLADSQVEFAEDNRLYVAPSLAWRNETTSPTILTHYRRTIGSEADQALPPDLIGELPVDLKPGDPDFDKDEATQWAIGYEFAHEIAPNLVVEQNLRYFQLDVDYRQLYLAYPLNDEGLYARSAYLLDETVKQLAVDTRLRWVRPRPAQRKLEPLRLGGGSDDRPLRPGLRPAGRAIRPVSRGDRGSSSRSASTCRTRSPTGTGGRRSAAAGTMPRRATPTTPGIPRPTTGTSPATPACSTSSTTASPRTRAGRSPSSRSPARPGTTSPSSRPRASSSRSASSTSPRASTLSSPSRPSTSPRRTW